MCVRRMNSILVDATSDWLHRSSPRSIGTWHGVPRPTPDLRITYSSQQLGAYAITRSASRPCPGQPFSAPAQADCDRQQSAVLCNWASTDSNLRPRHGCSSPPCKSTNSHSANNWIAKDRSEETASVAVKFMATDKWRNIEPPRSLSDLERATFAVLLAEPFPGWEALRRQAQIARVDAECTCGCGSIALIVDRDSP